MNLFDKILSFVYPCRCPCCGQLQGTAEPCDDCRNDLANQFVTGKVCKYCGLEKQYCQCSQYHYLFEGVTAPYYNRDTAQRGVYMLKFHNAPYAAEFFGNKMAENFKYRFPKAKIDFICIVPSSKKNNLKNLYDKNELLAKVCAEKLGLKLIITALEKIKETEKQHKLSHDRRQANVKGAYKATERFDGKTVLLIDDIKTTGYTLNECAKQLRLAGAEKVYCLTALVTLNNSCKSEDS